MADADDLSALKIEREPFRTGGSRWVTWVAFLIVLGAAGFAAWRWVTRERPLEVEVASVTERAAGAQASVLNASGYVTARRRATVSSKVTGKVVEVNVEEGMEVREGQVLARLDDSTLQAALRLYRAQLEAAKRQIPESDVRLAQARVQLQRQERLRKEGLNTPNDIDNAKAEVDSLVARIESAQETVKVAESQIAMQQTAIDDTVIRAPFSGVAISKDAQVGEMISPVSLANCAVVFSESFMSILLCNKFVISSFILQRRPGPRPRSRRKAPIEMRSVPIIPAITITSPAL